MPPRHALDNPQGLDPNNAPELISQYDPKLLADFTAKQPGITTGWAAWTPLVKQAALTALEGLGGGLAAGAWEGAMAGGAGAGASSGGFAGAADSVPLASSTIGTGMMAPIAGGTGLGTGMATGGGILGALDTGYNYAKKGKSIYDAFTSAGPGQSPSAASQIGQTAGSIEQQRMNALIQQARLQQEQDALGQSRARLALQAPGMEAATAARGDILANARDATVSGLPSYIHVGNVSGGLRPSLLSANTRALGANMSRNALANNQSGNDVPALTPHPSSTGLDTVLQGVGGASSLLGALSGMNTAGSNGPLGGSPTANSNLPSYDPSAADPNTGQPNAPMSLPTDPSGGTGQGPGVQGIDPALLEWFRQQANGGGA